MRILMVSILALTVAIAGCTEKDDKKEDPVAGDPDPGDNNTTAPPPVDITVDFRGPYPVNAAYTPSALTAVTNATVNLTFTNNDQNAALGNHNWVLEGVEGAATEVIGPGGSATVSFTAPAPGSYAFFCSVQGHRGNGMEGTFTVGAA